MTKLIMTLRRWAWCQCTGDREWWNKIGGAWKCSKCGRVES